MDSSLKVLGRSVRITAAVAGALTVLVLAGCGETREKAEPLANPFAAEFERARSETTDPLTLEVLADGAITDDELAQVEQATVRCYADQGLSAEFDSVGAIHVKLPPGFEDAEFDRIHALCSGPRTDVIRSLYDEMRENPTNIPRDKLLLDCFKRFDLLPDAMTLEQFQAIYPNDLPWDPRNGDANGCENDSIGYQGGAPDLVTPPTTYTFTVPPH